MKWFKFYGQDYLSDPKMLSLSACERSCWITLLSYSSINDNGVITFLSEEQLMIQAGIPFGEDEWDRAKGIVEKLKKLEMIDVDNEMITIKNWKKRQETSLTSYERVKRFRQKKRDDNAKITLEENRIEEKRIDINTSADKSASIPKKIKRKNRLDDKTLYTFEDFYESMSKSPQRHINIIAEYAKTKKVDYITKGQWFGFVDRNVRSARKLSPYSDAQIGEAFTKLEADTKTKNGKGFITKWGLETVIKYLE